MVEEAIQYNKNDDSNRTSSSQILSDLYPDPRSIPAPSALREPIPSALRHAFLLVELCGHKNTTIGKYSTANEY